MRYNCPHKNWTALIVLDRCFCTFILMHVYLGAAFWIPPVLAAHIALPWSQHAGMPEDFQLHRQRSTALIVSLNVSEARPSGSRIFLLQDDIFRDLIFKQQPREMLTALWKWASEDIFRSTCNLSNKPEAKHTRAGKWCLHWRANCAQLSCEERQSAQSRACLEESQHIFPTKIPKNISACIVECVHWQGSALYTVWF